MLQNFVVLFVTGLTDDYPMPEDVPTIKRFVHAQSECDDSLTVHVRPADWYFFSARLV